MSDWFIAAMKAGILQAVGFVRGESCPTQAVLPLVGLAADKVIRDRYIIPRPLVFSLCQWLPSERLTSTGPHDVSFPPRPHYGPRFDPKG
ncbi:MAG: hypothetical protein ACQESR_07185 [Planctomycetota bacterium]